MPDGTIPDLVTRSHGLHVRAVRDDLREADFVASTDAVDSYEESIDQASWKLDKFLANPVILYGHQSFELPIGQATRCEVVNGRLECTIKFATEEANPQAERVWKLVQQKVLRAVSVGFRPTDGKYELRDGKECFVLYGCDLREISVVAIPANHEALAKMKSAARAAQVQEITSAGKAAWFTGDAIGVIKPTEPTYTLRLAGVIGSGTTTTSAEGGAPTTQETDMTEKELREALDKAEKALTDSREVIQVEATKAADLDARVKALETEKSALAKELEKASADRDAALLRATEAEATIAKAASDAEARAIELEVDGLVGSKIAASEKDDFVQLRKNSPDLFTSMIAKRADLKLTERVTAPDTKSAPTGELNADPGATLWNKL